MVYILYITLIVLFVLNTFFGLGPVLLADGSFQERMITLAIVLIIYVFLIVIFNKIRTRKNRKNRKNK